ncbi:MAG: hypothetical protein B7X86_15335 [Sphingobacteriales bacterium 17-39-43]|uniref:M14 family zinc carboxypeptidase n=1 Tax=Daejeonella sp. TaxID=2805397 RepID=UPI000BD30E8B|nr:M14 family zinc carboxypeptidase [Daejeonella sp.]OYZ29470.1 MAG: hypothetical protein B7Y24_15105 [Sphingobacteriales bacterium 16-39-50]OZA22575.1 MAG: hypothetical protein B7X86_15335 [Sphingobacteriales bacterium 17-39-43]HQT24458.1 M14 family zinc carboxypeptidase [Daejeonella sp.]HQT59253.1 M14 family zinc carboxypeptidase [Daejeonella sp.]
MIRSNSLLLCALLLTMFQAAMCQVNLKSVDQVWDHYERYKEPVITNRFFKHTDVVSLIKKHTTSGLLISEEIGLSVKGRSINHLTLGTGKTKVLLWSQMHGDESTATMALFDLFNFLVADDEHKDLRKLILSSLELHIVPMLNPDGAQQWKRRNDLEIDVNRDARMLVTPEGIALMNLAKKIKPEIGFNLHDQSTLYAAGRTDNTATLSFLAPAYDYPKSMNEVRKRATQLILTMNKALQTKVPGKIAKYDDAFDPRCFGDTFQGMGISTILIESGGYYADPEKQHIRKLNFYALLNAFVSIAEKTYASQNLADYQEIPENSRSLYDVLVRNVSINKEGIQFRTNLGIVRSQIKSSDFGSMSYNGRIEELGDVELTHGYDEIEASSLTFTPGNIKLMRKSEWEVLSPQQELDLIREGYLFVKWTDAASPVGPLSARLLNLTNKATNTIQSASIGQQAQFLLSRDGKPVYALLNGYVLDLTKDVTAVPNVFGY